MAGDEVKHTRLHVDDACRLIETILIMVVMSGGLDVGR